MSNEIVSLIIALTCMMIQFAIVVAGARTLRKKRAENQEILELARKKRKAAITILRFAELWKEPMSDDKRVNLLIEWHDRLKEAELTIEMKEGKDME